MVERGHGQAGQLVDATLEGGQRTCRDEHFLDRGDGGVVEFFGAHAIEHVALCCGGERRGPSQQRCRFALSEVVADRLAGERCVSERADHVVAHLEGVAER